MVGGTHHSLALTSQGRVYSFGKNDDGQLGLGEDVELDKDQQEGANYIWRPRLMELSNITDLSTGSEFCYAIENKE